MTCLFGDEDIGQCIFIYPKHRGAYLDYNQYNQYNQYTFQVDTFSICFPTFRNIWLLQTAHVYPYKFHNLLVVDVSRQVSQ